LDGKSLPFAPLRAVTRLEQALSELSHRSTYLETLHNAARDLTAMNRAADVPDVFDIPNIAEAA
jgi:hypothetical protein